MAKTSKSAAKPTASDPLTTFFKDTATHQLSTAEYVSQGVTHVSDHTVDELVKQQPALRKRIAEAKDSPRLQRRLEAFVEYLVETAGTEGNSTPRHEIAFALAYFLHGSDRIPDSTPRYGFLDDALVVEAVLTRNEAALHAQAQRAGRPWPDNP